jgi:uncharacterized protein DUF4013
MPPRDTIDLARAFRFVPEDPDWIKKILIGGAFTLLTPLLVGAVFVAGYGVRLLRRSAAGEPRPLPEWDDLGGLFGDGLRAMALYLAYALPVTIVPMGLMVAVAVATAGLSGGAGSRGASDAFGAIAAIGFMGLYALMAVVMLVLSLYIPAALARFVMLDRLSAGFEVRENLDFIRRNLGNYAMTLLLYLLASFAAQLGILLCCVGFFPASFWAVCILFWGLGEVVRRDAALAPQSAGPSA